MDTLKVRLSQTMDPSDTLRPWYQQVPTGHYVFDVDKEPRITISGRKLYRFARTENNKALFRQLLPRLRESGYEKTPDSVIECFKRFGVFEERCIFLQQTNEEMKHLLSHEF